MPRRLGKHAATQDGRLMALRSVLPAKELPIPKETNWRADLPDAGIDYLGNDIAGCCVWATMAHYVQIASLYNGRAVTPTAAEVLGPDGYGSTGYPAQDNGTVIAGQGGALEWWANNGIVAGGERNKLTSATTIDHTNLDDLVRALSIGPVIAGAVLRQSDVDSDYLWVPTETPQVGGHCFLIAGHITLSSGKRYFDVCTWNGLWRFSDDWAVQALDEAYMVLDSAFFGPSGLDPADLDMAAVQSAMASLRV